MSTQRRLEGRNGRIWHAYIMGSCQEEIAEKEGLSQSRVSELIAQARASVPEQDLDEIRSGQVETLRKLKASMAEIVELPPVPAYSNGRPIIDERGRQVMDYSGRVAAAKVLAEFDARVAKLLGLEAPQKTQVEFSEAAEREAQAAAAAALARRPPSTDELA